MKHLKAKLMGAVVMLLISALMLGTASYAWFTISTAPEISGVTATVTTNETLEIALAKKDTTATTKYAAVAASDAGQTGNAYTWGNLVDFATGDAATAFTAAAPKLSPLGYTSGVFNYPKYGADGRVNTVDGTIVQTSGDSGIGLLKDGAGNVYGYYIDYWMRSNVGGTLKLATSGVDRGTGTVGGGCTFTGLNSDPGKALAAGINVAFGVVDKISGTTTSIALTSAPDAANMVAATKTVDSTDTYKATFACDSVATLDANTDTLVRMYVYVDGTLTNAAATIDTLTNNGTLNIQFCMENVDNHMAMPGDNSPS